MHLNDTASVTLGPDLEDCKEFNFELINNVLLEIFERANNIELDYKVQVFWGNKSCSIPSRPNSTEMFTNGSNEDHCGMACEQQSLTSFIVKMCYSPQWDDEMKLTYKLVAFTSDNNVVDIMVPVVLFTEEILTMTVMGDTNVIEVPNHEEPGDMDTTKPYVFPVASTVTLENNIYGAQESIPGAIVIVPVLVVIIMVGLLVILSLAIALIVVKRKHHQPCRTDTIEDGTLSQPPPVQGNTEADHSRAGSPPRTSTMTRLDTSLVTSPGSDPRRELITSQSPPGEGTNM